MKNGEGHTIYFLGIGGIGMSALARYYHSQGYTVAGYDRTPSPLTKQLEDEGMAIHYEDNPNLLPAFIDRVVYTPAVPKDLKEFDVLRQRGLPILKRSEALGQVTEGHFTIAVAGTHGKTTTTAMVAHILNHCGVSTTAFIGGIANNFNSHLLLSLEKARCLLTVSVSSQYAASVEPTEVSVYYGTKSAAQAIRYRTRCKSITSIITIL